MKFLNFGSCNIDYVYSMDHIVRVGETQSSDKLSVFPGGKGLNQSIALSRAGAYVYHAGCIGEGGELLLDTLTESGVDISYIRRVEEKNGHAIIQVSSEGENSIFLYAGSNAMISEEYVDSVLSNFSDGDYLLLQNEINNLNYIVDKAYDRGMFIILNPSPINEIIHGIDFSKLSCIILNEGEMEDVTGCSDIDESLEILKKKYPELRIMLTLGKNGCVYCYKNEKYFHPIFETVAVDTTAAGDTFTGYFMRELARGTEIKKILKIASCASAITVSRHGAAPSIPTMEEVDDALETMKAQNSTQGDPTLGRILKYIDENMSDASLEKLSEILGYSAVYTGTLTKKLSGMSFKKILQEQRLVRAAGLLKSTEMSVGDVIRTVGYENESYFREIFLEKYGCKPLEYKLKSREQNKL